MTDADTPLHLLAGAVASLLFVLAIIHVVWAARGRSASAAIPSHPDGTPLFRPGRAVTLLVAAFLTVAGLLVLARVSWNDGRWVPVATWVLAAVFALRAIGEFRYVGLFKRERSTTFARWDTMLFTPLCAGIAAAIAVLAAS
jgi:Protein of unknown function (DUF3995)